MKKLQILLLLPLFWTCAQEKPVLKLPALFSDHMVLQQSAENAIWGWANANSTVKIQTSWGVSGETTTGPEGKWLLKITAPAAGGPHEVSISHGDSTVQITDIYSGEVWVGSGQSNMEMPLKGWPPRDTIHHSAAEIAGADFPAIRMFTVKRSMSFSPVDTVIGSWEIATPETAGDFSATAWYFAKKLHQELGVPVGILHTSWGGTPAQAWTSAEFLEEVPAYEGVSTTIAGYQDYYDSLNRVYESLDRATVDLAAARPFEKLAFDDSDFESSSFDDSNWKTLNVPGAWESQWMPAFDGVVWIRKTFELTEAQLKNAGEAELFLGSIDDMDIAWLNGTRVGATEETGKWQEPRNYPIPAGLLQAGQNIVAVKIFDTGGGGGIFGYDQIGVRAKGSKDFLAPLVGEWKAKPVAESIFSGSVVKLAKNVLEPAKKPELPLSPHSPSTLYNAMINPILPYGIKGAIWYQGESNVGAAETYRILFPTMIKNWREAWGLGDFPFYYVQIAPYKYGRNDDLTAQLRDAQTATLTLPNTGMALTMDIGNPTNIHPGNKKDVGERLALWALAKDYGKEDVVFSGPKYKSMETAGNKTLVSFDYSEGLTFKGKPGYVEVAAGDGVFYPAQAQVDGDQLVAWSAKVPKPTAVRYGWCEACEPNLFNGAGLPAVPFNSTVK